MLNLPIVLFIFRRPDTTAQVVATIQTAQPSKLYVFADGPRVNRPGEAAACAAARAVVDAVAWSCPVERHYASANRGLRQSVVSGLNHVFAQEDRAIILEDDCVAHPTFFPYCAELLEQYATDLRVMAVSGNNFQQGQQRGDASYYFSNFLHCWGWATWARAWQQYDDTMERWPELRSKGWLRGVLGGNRSAMRYWTRMFDNAYHGRVDSWAFRWLLSAWRHDGLGILPNVNLVSNVGFGADGTHTRATSDADAGRISHEMAFPLRHPPTVRRDEAADTFTQRTHYKGPTVAQRIRHRLRS